jgi:mRNA interferase MazF
MRGDVITVAVSGDYGKPRPAVIIQADAFDGTASLTVLPLTSDLHDLPLLRVTVEPGAATGLRVRSQVMVDKPTTILRTKAGGKIGALDRATMTNVGQALRTFLELT